MQGVILSAGRARDLILGDDGARYTFTLEEWQGDDLEPEAGMRVDFEVRGSDAVDIFPILGAASMPPTLSPPPPRTTQGAVGAQPPAAPPPEKKSGIPGMKWWYWAAAVGALVVLGIGVAFALGAFGQSGLPVGREVARHTHEGKVYVLVEYGDELVIFAGSGAPVGQLEVAEGILHSYSWRPRGGRPSATSTSKN